MGHPGTQRHLRGSRFQAEKATTPLGDSGETARRPEVPLGPERMNLPFGWCGSCPFPGESWSASVCRDGLGGVALLFTVKLGAARPALLSGPPLRLPSLWAKPSRLGRVGSMSRVVGSREETAKCELQGSLG